MTVEEGEDGHEATDTVLAVGKHDRPARVTEQEVVDVQILLVRLRAVDASLREGASSPALLRQVNHLRSLLHPDLCHQHLCVERMKIFYIL